MRVIYGVDSLASVGIEGGYDRMTHMKLWYNLLYVLLLLVEWLFFFRSLILGLDWTGGTGWN